MTAKTPGEFESLYSIDGVLNGWTIARDSAPQVLEGTNGELSRVSVFTIRGFFAISSESDSEIVFNETIENIFSVFAPVSDLGEEIEQHEPLSARLIDYAQIGNTTCHYCELELRVNEFLSPND